MPEIVFLKDYTVNAAGGKTYRKGEKYTVTIAGARHFISRGAAADASKAKVIEAIEPEKDADQDHGKTQSGADEVGSRGGDAVQKFTKAQRKYRKKQLEE